MMSSKQTAWLIAVVTSVCLFVFGTACEDEDVGVRCDRDMADVGEGPEGTGGNVRINAQALSCRSRLCIKYNAAANPLCTAPCDSADDCPDDSETCKGGYACVVGQAVEGGGLGCCKLCVCKDFLPDPNTDPQAAACQGKKRTCPNI